MGMNPKAPHDPTTGKLIQTKESVELDARACELRSRGWSYRQIADELGDASVRTAYERVQRSIERIVQEPAEQARQFELDRLDARWRHLDELQAKTQTVLDAHHVVIQHGKVVYSETGDPFEDHGPVLDAVKTMLSIDAERDRIQVRRSKYLGLDAAGKLQLEGGVRYEIVGVDMSQLT